jgi:myo-inositol 2-dehydrogenase/D-chiro-inositol 1-dehydrogenase
MSSQEQDQDRVTNVPFGVGILGAGPVTQAIHLPTLARLSDIFTVTHVMDVDAAIAESVAGRVGARFSTTTDDLLTDPDVDVIAVCSPHRFHAEQVIAACRAGKKAVLCEKPFVMSAEQASAVSAVSVETGVPVIVGAMHTFDPGWLAAEKAWGDLTDTAHTIRSSIVLPPNARFEDFATEVISRPAPGKADYTDPEVIEGMIRGGVMGLAIHDLPLVRRFVPSFTDLKVLRSDIVKPFGYVIAIDAGGRSIELQAAITRTWQPAWTFEAISDAAALKVTFTPSYVHAGSSVAELRTAGETRTFGPFDVDGYEGEWRFLARLAGAEVRPPAPEVAIQDLTFALTIADAAAAAVLHQQQEAA